MSSKIAKMSLKKARAQPVVKKLYAHVHDVMIESGLAIEETFADYESFVEVLVDICDAEIDIVDDDDEEALEISSEEQKVIAEEEAEEELADEEETSVTEIEEEDLESDEEEEEEEEEEESDV